MDPGGRGSHGFPQTVVFPIENNGGLKTFRMKAIAWPLPQSPVLDYGPPKSNSGSAPDSTALKEAKKVPKHNILCYVDDL